eukprot:1127883-Amphidinium_carterae.1
MSPHPIGLCAIARYTRASWNPPKNWVTERTTRVHLMIRRRVRNSQHEPHTRVNQLVQELVVRFHRKRLMASLAH